jgi:hypothetical protein
MLLQTQQEQGDANVRKRSWNGDGKETNGHNGTCAAPPANTMLAQRSPWSDCDEQEPMYVAPLL